MRHRSDEAELAAGLADPDVTRRAAGVIVEVGHRVLFGETDAKQRQRGIGIWFSGPGAEPLLPGLVSERKRTFDQLFRSLQNPRGAVNAVLGFSRWFGARFGLPGGRAGRRKQQRAVSDGSLGAQKGW
jgi:hypothetical protein